MATQPDTPASREELSDILAAQTAELRDLATMGAVITSIHDIDAVLSVVMDMAVRLVNGEVGLIMLDEGEGLTTKISWGVQEEFVRDLLYKNQRDIATYCHETGDGVALTDLDITDEVGRHVSSVVCVPIKTSHRAHGAMTIINKTHGGGFTSEDKDRLAMLLNFVAVAIDNARLLQEQLRRQKIEHEMAIARQVQETILPQELDGIPRVEIGVAYYPAREVGGDFYDIRRLSDREFIVVVGDVSNKGVPAALVMSAAAGIMKSRLDVNPTIAMNELAGCLNNILVNDIIRHREMFITLFFAKFDLAAGEVTYCNAGHLPGLLWSAEHQQVHQLAEGGPIVGQFPDIPFQLGSHPIGPGDRLFLFTDGLTEAENATGQLFGRERAEQVFTAEIGLRPQAFCARVKEWVDQFTKGSSEDSRDDFTLLEVEVK